MGAHAPVRLLLRPPPLARKPLAASLISSTETEAKLCREFSETENPSRRALSLPCVVSLFSLLSPSSSLGPCGGAGGCCSRLVVMVRSRCSLVSLFQICSDLLSLVSCFQIQIQIYAKSHGLIVNKARILEEANAKMIDEY
ncbi:hypothetical protein F2Q69_00050433 [Brassica cretica]|uniref:Uncharacterized protein n=1 Tax=Brassica cretica TaxID=69181 RepID=A0A8S9PM90_BRACR|nr:hypothetical protein F2Q69_00050433 [Brassica cretica]